MTASLTRPGKPLRVRPCIRRATHRWSPDVVLMDMPEGLRLADLGRDRFYALNGTAAELVQVALQLGPQRAIRAVATKYGLLAAEVASDWRALSAELSARGLLEPLSSAQPQAATRSEEPVAAPRSWFARAGRALGRYVARALLAIASLRRAPSPTAASAGHVRLLLWAAWLAARSQPWRTVIQTWAAGPATDRRVQTDADRAAELQTIHDRVIALAARSWLPMACKERALVAWRLLRQAGETKAELVIGVAEHPFRAHAWVECAGQILTDDPAHCEPFRPVVRYDGPTDAKLARATR